MMQCCTTVSTIQMESFYLRLLLQFQFCQNINRSNAPNYNNSLTMINTKWQICKVSIGMTIPRPQPKENTFNPSTT